MTRNGVSLVPDDRHQDTLHFLFCFNVDSRSRTHRVIASLTPGSIWEAARATMLCPFWRRALEPLSVQCRVGSSATHQTRGQGQRTQLAMHARQLASSQRPRFSAHTRVKSALARARLSMRDPGCPPLIHAHAPSELGVTTSPAPSLVFLVNFERAHIHLTASATDRMLAQ